MISEYRILGIICTCGYEHAFSLFPSIWNNQLIKCECGEKYLPYINGSAFPLIFKNKEWTKYEGTYIYPKQTHKGS